MHINQNDAHRLVARCAAYPRASECRMHVVAVKKGGRWVVDHLDPRWEHDHDSGLDATHDSEGEEEDEDDEEDEDAERDASSACGEDSPGTPETASSSVAVPQLVSLRPGGALAGLLSTHMPRSAANARPARTRRLV